MLRIDLGLLQLRLDGAEEGGPTGEAGELVVDRIQLEAGGSPEPFDGVRDRPIEERGGQLGSEQDVLDPAPRSSRREESSGWSGTIRAACWSRGLETGQAIDRALIEPIEGQDDGVEGARSSPFATPWNIRTMS
ncbi:MAG: hypothetical protein R3E12_18195 [Candidatus Eisenbacteria bacterium]